MLARGDARLARNKALKYTGMCLIYGLHDLALAFLEAAARRAVVEPALAFEISGQVRAYDRWRTLPAFRGQHRLFSLLKRIEQRFAGGRWADGDEMTGNA